MAKQQGRWVTINGRHILIESIDDAHERILQYTNDESMGGNPNLTEREFKQHPGLRALSQQAKDMVGKNGIRLHRGMSEVSDTARAKWKAGGSFALANAGKSAGVAFAKSAREARAYADWSNSGKVLINAKVHRTAVLLDTYKQLPKYLRKESYSGGEVIVRKKAKARIIKVKHKKSHTELFLDIR